MNEDQALEQISQLASTDRPPLALIELVGLLGWPDPATPVLLDGQPVRTLYLFSTRRYALSTHPLPHGKNGMVLDPEGRELRKHEFPWVPRTYEDMLVSIDAAYERRERCEGVHIRRSVGGWRAVTLRESNVLTLQHALWTARWLSWDERRETTVSNQSDGPVCAPVEPLGKDPGERRHVTGYTVLNDAVHLTLGPAHRYADDPYRASKTSR